MAECEVEVEAEAEAGVNADPEAEVEACFSGWIWLEDAWHLLGLGPRTTAGAPQLAHRGFTAYSRLGPGLAGSAPEGGVGGGGRAQARGSGGGEAQA